MKFSEVAQKRLEYDMKKTNIPMDIHEFSVCEIFAKYLSNEENRNYDEAEKILNLENMGVDVILKSTDGNSVKLQITHPVDHNFNPKVLQETIDTSGLPIIKAAKDKCEKYTRRGLDTSDIILLLEGFVVGTFIEDLVSNPIFLKKFQDIKCFKKIYYIHNYNSGYVYPLK